MPQNITPPHVEQQQTIPIHELNKHSIAIQEIDCMSQGGFKKIDAMARLAKIAIEQSEESRFPRQEVLTILEAISEKAYETMNSINFEAEALGCNFIK